MLKFLLVRRTAEYGEIKARVSKYAIFILKGVQYSAPCQLIDHCLMCAPICPAHRSLARWPVRAASTPGQAAGGQAPWPLHRLPPPKVDTGWRRQIYADLDRR
jgi:hypothetical protein